MDSLILTDLMVLRRLTIRVQFYQLTFFRRNIIVRMLSTITASAFSELALEVTGFPSHHLEKTSAEYLGSWEEVDKFIQERFAERGDFKFIIGTGRLYYRETFQRHAEESFPLLAKIGCMHFERSHFVGE